MPFVSLDMSRMSFMRASSMLPAPAMPRASSATSSEISSLRIISSRPIIVFMGVRISWLMLEKKLLWFSFRISICFFCSRMTLFSLM